MEKQGNKALGIVAIVLGAIAIVTFYIPVFNVFSLICGIVGLVLAILSKKSFKEAGQTSPVPTVGLVLSIVGLALAWQAKLLRILSLQASSAVLSTALFQQLNKRT